MSIDLNELRNHLKSELTNYVDKIYFGENKGEIYWSEDAETWCYVGNDKTEFGKCGDLLNDVSDEILLSYYEEYKEDIYL